MRVILVGYSDSSGGAARGTYRHFKAIEAAMSKDDEVVLRVIQSGAGDPKVVSGKPAITISQRVAYLIKAKLKRGIHFRGT